MEIFDLSLLSMIVGSLSIIEIFLIIKCSKIKSLSDKIYMSYHLTKMLNEKLESLQQKQESLENKINRMKEYLATPVSEAEIISAEQRLTSLKEQEKLLLIEEEKLNTLVEPILERMNKRKKPQKKSQQDYLLKKLKDLEIRNLFGNDNSRTLSNLDTSSYSSSDSGYSSDSSGSSHSGDYSGGGGDSSGGGSSDSW